MMAVMASVKEQLSKVCPKLTYYNSLSLHFISLHHFVCVHVCSSLTDGIVFKADTVRIDQNETWVTLDSL